MTQIIPTCLRSRSGSSAKTRENVDYAEPAPIRHTGSSDSVNSMKPMGLERLEPPPRVSALNIQELVAGSAALIAREQESRIPAPGGGRPKTASGGVEREVVGAGTNNSISSRDGYASANSVSADQPTPSAGPSQPLTGTTAAVSASLSQPRGSQLGLIGLGVGGVDTAAISSSEEYPELNDLVKRHDMLISLIL